MPFKKVASVKENANPQPKIYEILSNNNIEKLNTIEELLIEKFSYKGINAFTYACYLSNSATILRLIEIMESYIKKNYKNEDDRGDALVDFFYESFFDGDNKAYSRATILALRSKGRDHAARDAYKAFNYVTVKFKFFTNVSELIRNLAISNGARAGFYTDSLIHRPPRAFTKERERQLLKQLSTVLFFALRSYLNSPDELIEIQTMNIIIQDKNYLLVAANEVQASSSFKKIIEKEKNLK